ncbi:sensor histidine kinase [Microbacterium rhizosphaerae]|uniref:histidine kinase n=1 Tax=Microbacterium rhizosphaerae TaxID=1678237 RepID=A0ABZ0SJY7_9MICO|nr:HAMP domain-containing sensor histidine kinase [Microbacterium rhizosphaerae]WPR88536.1 HAMP domain-containing sensor histidine kinase [Microbacterium rhizosphaerae]
MIRASHAAAPRPLSTRARILSAILAVACVGLAVVGGVTFLVQRDRVLSEVDARLKAQVGSLETVASPAPAVSPNDSATTATEKLSTDDFSSVSDYLHAVVARLVPAQNEGSVAVIDGRARYRPSTLSGFDLSQNTQLITRAVAETARAHGTVIGTADTSQGALRYIAIPVTMSGDPESGLYIRAINLDAELSPVTASITTYGIAAVVMLAAIGLVGWFVAGRLLSPIRRLHETADAITLTDLGARIPAEGNDDISAMTRTVNSMLDRLESSVDVQRQLLDDVRHELKTPITIVRGHLELMDAADATDVDETRQLGIAELDRMTRLVDDIDLLAAVEGDQYTMVDIALDRLTARIGGMVAVIPGHTWTIESTGSGVIHGDEDRLLQAWLALADNAAKYSPPGAPIELGSSIDEHRARLWVRDHGPGIPPDMRRRVFRRFDRAGGKRSIGGSGLGLAIVEAIAKAHDGACTITDSPGGGATFSIELPRHPMVVPTPVRADSVTRREEAS